MLHIFLCFLKEYIRMRIEFALNPPYSWTRHIIPYYFWFYHHHFYVKGHNIFVMMNEWIHEGTIKRKNKWMNESFNERNIPLNTNCISYDKIPCKLTSGRNSCGTNTLPEAKKSWKLRQTIFQLTIKTDCELHSRSWCIFLSKYNVTTEVRHSS